MSDSAGTPSASHAADLPRRRSGSAVADAPILTPVRNDILKSVRLVILDGYALNPGDLSWGKLAGLVDEFEVHDRTPEALVVERTTGAHLVLTNKTPVSAASLAQLAELRYIGVLATGYNIVDVAAAKERGVTVTNIPTYGTDSVAQFTMALLLELCHHIGLHSDAARNGAWAANPDWCFWRAPLVELAGKTLGVVGYGRIGRRTAEMAVAFGMKVLAFDSYVPADPGPARIVDLAELLRESDVVTLHCPLTPETRNLLDSKRISGMKRGAFLLNASRGGLAVEEDVAAALKSGHLGGAAFDVLSVEPPVNGSPLLAAKNCIVTPHIAWATREARTRLLDIAIDNIRAFLAGRPQNVVG
jgi:glycerate dehydrogenase